MSSWETLSPEQFTVLCYSAGEERKTSVVSIFKYKAVGVPELDFYVPCQI